MLKNSPRSSMFRRSLKVKVLMREKSRLTKSGPRTIFRPMSPNCPGSGGVLLALRVDCGRVIRVKLVPWEPLAARPVNLPRVAVKIPPVVVFARSADVISIVIEVDRLSALRGKNGIEPPLREQLRGSRFAWELVGRRERQPVADIEVGIAALRRDIVAVLYGRAAVAASIVDGVRPGIAG